MIELLRAANAFEAWLKKHTGLTGAQYEFLAAVAKLGNPTMGEAEKEAGIAFSTGTSTADRLERDGFLRRVRSTEDRRVVRLELVNPEWFAGITEMLQATFGRLPDASYLAAYADGMDSIVPVYPAQRPA